MSDNFLEKTGKPLEEWIILAKSFDTDKHSDIMNRLKKEYGLTHGYANTVALMAREAHAAAQQPADLVSAQYQGKEELLPIYHKLVDMVQSLGTDVELAPKKANVSVRRKLQFALIQPTTKTRIDLGLKLRHAAVAGRLESSGPFGTMCTHRVQLTDVSQVNEEVLAWLREAYQEAG